FGWGVVDDDDSVAAIRRAIELGVNWVDTAAVYGLGHSEEVVGQAVREHGGEVLIFTKCGRPWYGRENNEPTYGLKPETIRFELEQSLKRLGADHIDLYQFHWPDTVTGTPVEDSWATMADLVTEGKIRWAGVSNFDVALLERCARIRHVDSLQPPFSLVDRSAADEIAWCAANGTGVLCYSPLGSGLLTGSFDADRVRDLPAGDWRRTSDEFRPPRLEANLEVARRLEPVAERHGVPVAAVAVAWVLAVEGVTAAIVGARRPSQVDGWLPAGELRLTGADLAGLA
ncbi:MAG TPA: aldo/keto reductase, partial [Actinomycetota bacterium]|nr:aldo/keto reductase [Actinomycetota bacterium]